MDENWIWREEDLACKILPVNCKECIDFWKVPNYQQNKWDNMHRKKKVFLLCECIQKNRSEEKKCWTLRGIIHELVKLRLKRDTDIKKLNDSRLYGNTRTYFHKKYWKWIRNIYQTQEINIGFVEISAINLCYAFLDYPKGNYTHTTC